MTLTTDHGWFKDEHRRVILLRGVNLAGSSKVPMLPPGGTHHAEGFFDHRIVSFVGRPLPLAEAEEHLRRLKSWGFTFLRFLVTWEAVEHAGPGLYDTDYLDYLERVVRRAGDMGFIVFIDPHQDVWSRFTGGDGAPGWTLEAAGFDMTHFRETGAAVVHQTHGDPFPRMVWPTNASKLASATMFTLFFGGNDFAPHLSVDGVPIQEYLQQHYVESLVQVARRLQGIPCVIGYDTLNEPSHGYIGWKDLSSLESPLLLGDQPTPLQSFALGEGHAQQVAHWEIGLRGRRQTGLVGIDPHGTRAWREGIPCIWREHGVWDQGDGDEPHLLQPDYFSSVGGRSISFGRDYLAPFVRRVAEALREVAPQALIFVESEPDALPEMPAERLPGLVWAPHWYDAVTMLFRRNMPWIGVGSSDQRVVVGKAAVRRLFRHEFVSLRQQGVDLLGAPTVIGETGIPFDFKGSTAFQSGDFRQQCAVLDRILGAAEEALVSTTIWNYTPDNSNEYGDQWNAEDFSIWSADQGRDQRVLDAGGRALQAIVRPYPLATAGEPLALRFDMRRRILHYTFRHDPAVIEPTVIFLPPCQYPQGYRVWISDGTFFEDAEGHTLLYRHTLGRPNHTIIVKPRETTREHGSHAVREGKAVRTVSGR